MHIYVYIHTYWQASQHERPQSCARAPAGGAGGAGAGAAWRGGSMSAYGRGEGVLQRGGPSVPLAVNLVYCQRLIFLGGKLIVDQ